MKHLVRKQKLGNIEKTPCRKRGHRLHKIRLTPSWVKSIAGRTLLLEVPAA